MQFFLSEIEETLDIPVKDNDLVLVPSGESVGGFYKAWKIDAGQRIDFKVGPDLEATLTGLLSDMNEAYAESGFIGEWWALPTLKEIFGDDFDVKKTWFIHSSRNFEGVAAHLFEDLLED